MLRKPPLLCLPPPHPAPPLQTPDRSCVVSKRQWDGLVRAWRRQLHEAASTYAPVEGAAAAAAPASSGEAAAPPAPSS